MKISVFGTGYVGLVTGVCFAEMGNDVICSDIDQSKIDLLNRGQSPIFEKGLEAMIKSNADSGRLKFTTSLADSIAESDLLFIAVGTPSEATGAADLTAVENVARFIGKHLQSFK
ncbi:MAG: UDP-glucose 6-dehydrogenase, partial [Pseudobdellovibrionaceae bacterium]